MSNEKKQCARCGGDLACDHKQAREHNGWANYETWAVALWLDNEFAGYQFWTRRARETLASPDDQFGFMAQGTFTREEVATGELADELKEHMEEGMPLLEPSMYVDLLNAALSEVDWREIASHYIDAASESAQVQS